MKTQIYSIYDMCSAVYAKPIFARSDGEVVREFQRFVNDPEHPFGQHPEHYLLFRSGTFDDITGKVTFEEPECIARGMDVLAPKESVDPVERAGLAEVL